MHECFANGVEARRTPWKTLQEGSSHSELPSLALLYETPTGADLTPTGTIAPRSERGVSEFHAWGGSIRRPAEAGPHVWRWPLSQWPGFHLSFEVLKRISKTP